MVYSMTGFGRARTVKDGYRIVLEIKSLNHRFLDISIRASKMLGMLEEKLRKAIKERLDRGRIEVTLTVEELADEMHLKPKLNAPLARSYIEEIQKLARECGVEPVLDVASLGLLPDVFSADHKFDEESMWPVVDGLLKEALDEVVEMRRKEGERIVSVLKPRLFALRGLIEEITRRAPLVVEHYRERLKERIKELSKEAPVDEARLATEVAFFAERSDITEEIDRFKSHIEAFSEFLKQGGPVGRKLEFIIQELYREANTLSAKAHDYEISRCVVEIKSELEKTKEQVHNLE